MKTRQISLLILFVLFSACTEEDLFSSGTVPQTVLDNSVQLFDGNIIDQSTRTLDGVDVWVVKLEKNTGATVTFYWQRKSQIIYRIVGEKGPFNYELKPPLNTLVFSTAKFLAFESYSKETLESWQLLRDSSHNLKWVYQFYIRGQDAPITINAISGDML